MKKINCFSLLALLFFFLLPGILKSQDDKGQRLFHGGVLGGITATQVHNDISGGFNKVGLYAGVYLQTHFADRWKAELGMNYAGKGAREVSRDKNDVFNKYVMRLGYLEFPLVIKFNLKKWDFELGPSFGFLLFGKEFDQYGEQNSPTAFKKYELAGIVGVNFMANEKLGFNLRSQTSILPIRTPNDNVYYTIGQAQYNIVLSLTVRYFVW